MKNLDGLRESEARTPGLYTPTRQRVVVLTFDSPEHAEAFDRQPEAFLPIHNGFAWKIAPGDANGG